MSELIDITNHKFGRWTAIRHIGVQATTRRAVWECVCECGNKGAVNSQDLRDGHSRSCGCLSIDSIRARSQKPDSGLNKLFRQYKKSAQKRALEFLLSLEEFKTITGKDCYYCGQIPIAVSIKTARIGAYIYNGIDRKDNNLGYTKENSLPCCQPCNFLKKDMPYLEFMRRISSIQKQQMGSFNRLANCKNPYQENFKRVLAVCSAGLLRSPTVSWVLSNPPYNYNTRAVGLDIGHALVPIDNVLLEWADEIVCMDEYQQQQIEKRTKKPVINLEIGDCFSYRDPELIQMIKKNYTKAKGISL